MLGALFVESRVQERETVVSNSQTPGDGFS